MEVAPGVTVEEVVSITDADLIIADDINEMKI
jgi:acetate CoA/acetoacetate CoA-transferase beta subunit